ncbi:MAG: S-methyl-5-thioribose-1-phosphate isomerase [Methanobacteriota archaeon]|nr:MAG: S-methyl-5-thioribose-1-phosphate isomerase [Euryarchaeota archaeon]
MEGPTVRMIDQRYLPHELRVYVAESYKDVAAAIREMVVRGAPAIGAAAAYGLAQAAMQGVEPEDAAEVLRATRPTGHDLFFAIEYMLRAVGQGENPAKAADAYAALDEERCRRIGEYGERLVTDGSRILTHCNAGALACVDIGTVTAPLRLAHARGRKFLVYVDETRPRLQGSRLTAWELAQEGIEHVVIVDNAAGLLMQQGKVDLVLVGADRIAANGDVANKIGTYEKAVLAKENGVPFFVAAPTSTFDFAIRTGREIPIENRAEDEVLSVGGMRIAPEGVHALNPAFDITPAKYVTGFVTERGIVRPADVRKLRPGAARRSARRPAKKSTPKKRKRR